MGFYFYITLEGQPCLAIPSLQDYANFVPPTIIRQILFETIHPASELSPYYLLELSIGISPSHLSTFYLDPSDSPYVMIGVQTLQELNAVLYVRPRCLAVSATPTAALPPRWTENQPAAAFVRELTETADSPTGALPNILIETGDLPPAEGFSSTSFSTDEPASTNTPDQDFGSFLPPPSSPSSSILDAIISSLDAFEATNLTNLINPSNEDNSPPFSTPPATLNPPLCPQPETQFFTPPPPSSPGLTLFDEDMDLS